MWDFSERTQTPCYVSAIECGVRKEIGVFHRGSATCYLGSHVEHMTTLSCDFVLYVCFLIPIFFQFCLLGLVYNSVCFVFNQGTVCG